MGAGHHEAAWRHPRADPALVADVRHHQRPARIAERGGLDSASRYATPHPAPLWTTPVC
ncbi:hypothetical protein [Sphaerisporangium sp. TRM90804]|uniref:hypothetical protein n=1 Tax=Sphaerisporangium sp. TRM90804 TaxID=3031113 RepID=UPI00244CBA09|nr:hypothetical protein [Sphaerisporangium sp. TRM90804]MDH2428017.1 hypothetical protein [Sphaerisporangium sp. TRM90804]